MIIRVCFGAALLALPAAAMAFEPVDLAPGARPGVLALYGTVADGRLGSNEGAASFLDFNHDGFSDILMGAYRARRSGDPTDANGEAYILLGNGRRETGPVDIGAWPAGRLLRILGDDPTGLFGAAVAAGDLNGDGYEDAIISAPLADRGSDPNNESGEVVVLYGASVWTWPANGANFLLDLGPGAPVTLHGETRLQGPPGWQLGFSLACADLDGDGYDDLIAGAPFARSGSTDFGRVVIVFGSASKLGQPSGAGSFMSLEASPTAAESRLTGSMGSKFGYSLATGDVNGDGIADLAVGAPDAASGQDLGAGAVYIFYGGTAIRGLDTSVTSVSGVTVFLGDDGRKGAANGDRFGQAIALGDRNGDGLADLVVGAPQADRRSAGTESDTDEGEVYLLSARSPWPGRTYTLNSNGAISPEGETRILGETASYTGWAVATPDLDGSGSEDLFLTSALASPLGRARAGSGSWYSSAQHTRATSATTSSPAPLIPVYGPGADEFYGHSLAAGDYDGDGITDLLSTAVYGDSPFLSDPADKAGAAWLIYGELSGPQASTVVARRTRPGDGPGGKAVKPVSFGATRLTIDFRDDDQAAASQESVTLARGSFSTTPPFPLPEASRLPLLWTVGSSRVSANPMMTVRLTEAELAGGPPEGLRLYRLAPGGALWEPLAYQQLDTARRTLAGVATAASGRLAIGRVSIPFFRTLAVAPTDPGPISGFTRSPEVRLVPGGLDANGGTPQQYEFSFSPTFLPVQQFPVEGSDGGFPFSLGDLPDGPVVVYGRLRSSTGVSLAVAGQVYLDRTAPQALIATDNVAVGSVGNAAEYRFRLEFREATNLAGTFRPSESQGFRVSGATVEFLSEADNAAEIRLVPSGPRSRIAIEVDAGVLSDAAGNASRGARFEFLHDTLPPEMTPEGPLTPTQDFAHAQDFVARYTVTFTEPIMTSDGSLKPGLHPAALSLAQSTVPLRQTTITVRRLGPTNAGPWEITARGRATRPGTLLLSFVPGRIFDTTTPPAAFNTTGIIAVLPLQVADGWRME